MRLRTLVPSVLVLSCAVMTGPFAAETQETLEAVLDGYFRETMARDPEQATRLGLPDSLKIAFDEGALTDGSIQAQDSLLRMARAYRTRLESVGVAGLTPSQRLMREVLLGHLDNLLEGEKYRFHSYVINHMFGLHYTLTTLMSDEHPVESLQDAENYLSRLDGFPGRIKAQIEQSKARVKRRILPPVVIIDRTEEAMADFIATPATENILYTSFKDRVDKLAGVDEKVRRSLVQQAEKKVRGSVYPAYRNFIAYLAKVKPKATTDAGAWKLPDGDRFYAFALRTQTTTSLTPEQVHQTGLREVARIQGEMKVILESLGITEGKTMGELMGKYGEQCRASGDPRFFYPGTEAGRRQALKDYQSIIDDVEKKLPALFSLLPKTPVEVKAIPEHQGPLPPHYAPASLDGKRKGVFYANLFSLPFKPGMQTLTYHEAIPGHHFQFAIEQESPHNPLVRNLFGFTAFVEGWALYAERLGRENGWFEDPHTRLSNLSSELLRAARLVLDTGLHYKRWSREHAFSYMQDNLGWASYGSIDRYIVLPGQACAYKIGELKLVELRERAQKALGERFDIREFHRVVTQHGSVPLDVLERLVEDYIKKASGS